MGVKKLQNSNFLQVEADTNRFLLFYQFTCPHCETVNVIAKEFKQEIVRCSSPGCLRVIVIKNFSAIK